jgi:DNA-binding NtrC family response regulator
VQSINEVGGVAIESGFDFYDEVSRFEINLIRRALVQTGGHQVRAAKLLNLKVTTLNSKIKHYQISLQGPGNVFALVDPNQHLVEPQPLEERQHASQM